MLAVDTDFSFVINLYQSSDLETCLSDLRRAYPNSPVCLIADGDGWDYSPLARKYDCQLIESVRLKATGGGFWTERFLTWFAVEGSTEWLIKIDPDTVVARSLTVMPPTVGLFGFDYRKAKGQPGASCHGGCQGFSRDACVKILNSDLLAHPRYQQQNRFWYFSNKHRLSFQDGVLSDIIWLLSLPVFDHPEIYCDWLVPPKHPERWAMYHPYYLKTNWRSPSDCQQECYSLAAS